MRKLIPFIIVALVAAVSHRTHANPSPLGVGIGVTWSADFSGNGSAGSPIELSTNVTMPGVASIAGTAGTTSLTVTSTTAGGVAATRTATAGTNSAIATIYGRGIGTYDTTAAPVYVYGVRGDSQGTRSSGANDLNNYGGLFLANGAQATIGALGWVTGGTDAAGVLGLSDAAGTTAYGIKGTARGGATTNYAVYGDATGGTTNYAGYFNTGLFRVQGAATLNSTLAVNDDATFESGTCVINSAGITCGGTLITPGADITAVTAGNGLTGGGTSGAVTLDVAVGTGLSVAADQVNLNLAGASCSAGSFISALDSTGTGTCTAASGGITNSAGANVIPKSNGTNLVASSVTDDGTTFAISTNKLTVTESSGNTTIAGTLGVTGKVSGAAVSNTGAFQVTAAPSGTASNVTGYYAPMSGTVDATAGARSTYGINISNTITKSAGANTLTNYGVVSTASGGTSNYSFYGGGGTMRNDGDFIVNSGAADKFTVTASSGNTAVAGTLGVTGDMAINTNKFTVAASTGNTAVAGTLGVTGAGTYEGALTVNNAAGASGDLTVKKQTTGTAFSVASASGNTTIAGTLGVTGDVAVNSTQFTVTASNGNVVGLGTAWFKGNATLGDAAGDQATVHGQLVLDTDSKGLKDSATAPTLSSCGTGSTVSAGQTGFTITFGTGSFSSCTATFGVAFGGSPTCVVSPESSGSSMRIRFTSVSASAVTIASDLFFDSNKAHIICVGH